MHRLLKSLRQLLALSSFFWLAATLASFSVAPAVMAAKIVPQHELGCSADFPCPDALHRRVDFWIEVFSKWDKNTAILHDNEAPWRVYQTVNGVDGCSVSKVKKARKRLKANLNALADRLKKDQQPAGKIQQHLADQFERLNSSIVYKAAKNIRCQQGVKDQFVKALSRFERYKPLVESVIAETNMPKDLLYLPFVESSYRADAYSKVGAAGMWQIMPKTARTLGMELNAVFDERLDPEQATRGAMRYFKNAQKKLNPLARNARPGIAQADINPFIVTSYNYGINGMRRAIKQIGPDFPKVLQEYKSAAFQVAVKNFYASFLAARHLASNAQRYFGNTKAEPTLRYQTFVLPTATSIDRIKHQFKLGEDQLKPLNPSLTRFAWNNWRLIPAGYRLRLPYREHRWVTQIDALKALSPEPQSLARQVYRVRRGDTACGIANAFKVKCRELIAANKLGRKAIVRIGQKLDIPGRTVTPIAKATSSKKSLPSSGIYRVKSGDTACGVASRFGVACRELIRLNKLGRKAKIVVGQKLTVPGLGTSDAVAETQSVSTLYRVKSGDTACEIAARYAVPCARLIADNNLGRKARLKVGQQLTITGRSSATSKKLSVSEYKVRRGDTACEIASRFDVPCADLIKTNKLGRKARISVGQILKITSQIGPEAVAEVSDDKQRDWLAKVDTLPDMSLTERPEGVAIKTLPDETLVHYADWIGARSSGAIRNLNNIQQGADLGLGKTILLPIKSAKTKEQFKSKRSEFHQVLVEEFKERFNISEVKSIPVKSGQSLWTIAKHYETPLWLLMRFNPEKGSSLQPGQVIEVPQIAQK